MPAPRQRDAFAPRDRCIGVAEHDNPSDGSSNDYAGTDARGYDYIDTGGGSLRGGRDWGAPKLLPDTSRPLGGGQAVEAAIWG
mgnify:CR=1 FL=1